MKKCSKCGKEFEIGMYSLVSDLCDDCYEKLNYPNVKYVKSEISETFYLPSGKYTYEGLLMFFMECIDKVHAKIRKAGINQQRNLAVIFEEFDKLTKIKELIRQGKTELRFSYYFCDSPLDTVPSYEDRNKQRSAMFLHE